MTGRGETSPTTSSATRGSIQSQNVRRHDAGLCRSRLIQSSGLCGEGLYKANRRGWGGVITVAPVCKFYLEKHHRRLKVGSIYGAAVTSAAAQEGHNNGDGVMVMSSGAFPCRLCVILTSTFKRQGKGA